jgi:hypothetical protein
MWKWIEKINARFAPQQLGRTRIVVALAVAVAADALQVATAELVPLPEILDVIAMIVTTLALGFHLLLLPTFALEFFPLVDIAPTWTGCVIAVILLRKRKEWRAAPDAEGRTLAQKPPQK